ncbi:GNAT family N-acetyltransferase [Polaribacter sp. Hel1_85]|uniref:GNAT family N-acetyltransferase n=1 Tax=Polaribacter sp. Hel1_85 TaxID=1250005 RepID=UPI00052D045F|nr:GNAT family N-acetyltransferase [Polaribacter sp. Hel1_85]KGL63707.1 acetyltransferase (GNAT) family protein [Polaribacter sp. Hel1_85]
MIFITENLLVRRLVLEDLKGFHELESNPKVLKYATGNPKVFSENEKELKELIFKYSLAKNDFWIYAVERKIDLEFIGTVALVKDNLDDEIGYRFLEKYWKLGYGSEICKGLISYCKKIGLKKIVAHVVDENKASAKILENNKFKIVKKFISDDIKLPETKYELKF